VPVQWQEVLDILADALNDNNIKYRMLHTSRKFEVTAFVLLKHVANLFHLCDFT